MESTENKTIIESDGFNESAQTPTLGDNLPEVKLSVMVQNIKNYLIAQPKPDAAAVAKASLLPFLYSLKQDIWNPQCLRQVESHDRYLRYHLEVSGEKVSIDVWGVGQDLKRPPVRSTLPKGAPWGVRTNGGDWQLIIFDNKSSEEDIFDFSLYGDAFREVGFQLFNPQQDSLERRLMLAKSLLIEDLLRKKLYRLANTFGMEQVQQKDFEGILKMLDESGLLDARERELFKTDNAQSALENYIQSIQHGYVRIMKPLSDITLEDVQHHCQVVKNLKGGLKAEFDGTILNVSARSGFYYVLAAVAVQFGRSDAILPEDLIRPPEDPPKEKRNHPLGRPGWYLVFSNPDDVESAASSLLDKLNLRHRFDLTYNKAPFASENQ